MVSLGELVQQRMIPGAHGGVVSVKEGQYLKVIDVQGKQVCDFFAFNPVDPTEFLSPSHTRSSNGQMNLEVGRPLYNNARQPILLLEEDKVRIHDMCFAACDPIRYLVDYGVANHRNCKMNTLEALGEFNLWPPVFPDPVNLFMNSPIDRNGKMTILPPVSGAGDYVIFRALRDLIVAGSACPMDLNPTNNFNPTDIMFEVYEA